MLARVYHYRRKQQAGPEPIEPNYGKGAQRVCAFTRAQRACTRTSTGALTWSCNPKGFAGSTTEVQAAKKFLAVPTPIPVAQLTRSETECICSWHFKKRLPRLYVKFQGCSAPVSAILDRLDPSVKAWHGNVGVKASCKCEVAVSEMCTLLDLCSVARMVFLPMAANADRTFSRLLEFKCQLLAKGIPEPDAAIVWQSLHDSRDAEANFQSIAGFLTCPEV